MKRVKSLLVRRIPLWTFPLALLALAAISYLPLANRLGFYWDDWAQLLVARLFDLNSYWRYFTADRPLSAWTHILYMPLVGGSPLSWHIFTLLLRCASGLGMAWTFSNLWPAAKLQISMASLLFMVYPAFTQQSIVVAYSQHWTQYALFFVSLGAMIKATRSRKHFWPFTLLALATQLLQYSITEFFFGAELARPIILWFLLSRDDQEVKNKKFLGVLKAWLPYLIVDGLFLFWRFYLYTKLWGEPHPAELLSGLATQPLAALSKLATLIVQDMLYILLTSWTKVVDIGIAQINQPLMVFSWLVSLAVLLGLSTYFFRLEEQPPQEENAGKRWLKEALIIGAFITLVGPSPIWATGTNILNPDDVHADRFALVSMFGVCILIVAFIEWAIRGRLQKALIMGALIGLAAGFQIRAANEYRWIWTLESRFYWQLAWRAPSLKPQTMLLAQDIFLPEQELFSTTAAINLLYPQERYPKTLDYSVYTMLPRYSRGYPKGGLYFQTVLRILNFNGSTSRSLLIQFDPSISGCLWVLKPGDKNNPDLPELTISALKAAHLERIVDQPAASGYPPTDLFGPEPAHDWCYFYQKAELAGQFKDWNKVVDLGNQARDEGYQPANSPSNTPYEWLTFIEGYAMSGDWKEAQELTSQNLKVNNNYRTMLCEVWERINKNAAASTEKDAALNSVTAKLGCATQPAGVDN